MKRIKYWTIFLGTILTLLLWTAIPVPAEDPVAEWNKYAATLALAPSPTPAPAPVQQTRLMAIVQVSVHDAVNGITGEYETYLKPLAPPANASPEAAAISAAYHSLAALFPDRSPHPSLSLEQLFMASLASRGISPANPGVAYGQAVAASILALRANDGAAGAQFAYNAPNVGVPGVWQRLNNAPALLPGWGSVKTWVILDGSQFALPPPPSLNSKQYARDYNEIVEIGALNSTTRTAPQTQIATFWRASPTAIWNQALNQFNAMSDFNLSTRARTYALVYIAVADSSVACWAEKYRHNFWRPQPAIWRGDEDGNDDTDAVAGWTPLFATPPHPEYPSGHTVNSTAMATILAQIFGDDPGKEPISVTITGINRQWNTFTEGTEEVIDARVYSGIHFRTADEVGSRLGGQIAQYVFAHALKPCAGRRSCR